MNGNKRTVAEIQEQTPLLQNKVESENDRKILAKIWTQMLNNGEEMNEEMMKEISNILDGDLQESERLQAAYLLLLGHSLWHAKDGYLLLILNGLMNPTTWERDSSTMATLRAQLVLVCQLLGQDGDNSVIKTIETLEAQLLHLESRLIGVSQPTSLQLLRLMRSGHLILGLSQMQHSFRTSDDQGGKEYLKRAVESFRKCEIITLHNSRYSPHQCEIAKALCLVTILLPKTRKLFETTFMELSETSCNTGSYYSIVIEMLFGIINASEHLDTNAALENFESSLTLLKNEPTRVRLMQTTLLNIAHLLHIKGLFDLERGILEKASKLFCAFNEAHALCSITKRILDDSMSKDFLLDLIRALSRNEMHAEVISVLTYARVCLNEAGLWLNLNQEIDLIHADALVNQGDLSKALELLKKWEKDDCFHARRNLLTADVYLSQGMLVDALTLYRTLASGYGTNDTVVVIKAKANLAVILVCVSSSSDSYETSLKHLEGAWKLFQDNFADSTKPNLGKLCRTLSFSLCTLYLANGRYGRACELWFAVRKFFAVSWSKITVKHIGHIQKSIQDARYVILNESLANTNPVPPWSSPSPVDLAKLDTSILELTLDFLLNGKKGPSSEIHNESLSEPSATSSS